MALAIALSFLLGPAFAGTETGEFCPTCPDWTNLEGWLAQKEAYERAHQNDWQKSNVNNDANTKADKAGEANNSKVIKELKEIGVRLSK